jgi:hypothetical protein
LLIENKLNEICPAPCASPVIPSSLEDVLDLEVNLRAGISEVLCVMRAVRLLQLLHCKASEASSAPRCSVGPDPPFKQRKPALKDEQLGDLKQSTTADGLHLLAR